jgi:glyoxylase-like metal-dependent hydrolase (beta-lactamase superfamily II)
MKDGKTAFGAGKWRAKTLNCGIHVNAKGALTAGFDMELRMKLPYLAFLLQDGKRNILIDNGMNERFLIDGKAWGGCPADAGSKDLLAALAKEGVKPDDIDLIIYTHLHNDHAGNCDFFPNTKSIAQKDEWYNLTNTVFAEKVRRDYDLEVIPFLQANRNFFRIEGDLELMEGLKVIKTPGHTRGSQSVVANTTNGIRVFVGDQFHLPCSCFPRMKEMYDCDGAVHKITPPPEDWPTIPSSLVYNYYAYYESAEKIKSVIPALEPEYVVCGHDPALLFREL